MNKTITKTLTAIVVTGTTIGGVLAYNHLTNPETILKNRIAEAQGMQVDLQNNSIKLREILPSVQLDFDNAEMRLERVKTNIAVNSGRWETLQGFIDIDTKQLEAITADEDVADEGLKIFMTSYNAEKGQTDSTPCIAGGTGLNICEEEKKGERIIALSQELTAWSTVGKARKKMNCGKACITFEAGEKVILKQSQADKDKHGINSRCEGEFTVGDAMNVRFRKRGDLFFSDRSMNTSCEVTINKTK